MTNDNPVSDDNLRLLVGEAIHGAHKGGWMKVERGMVRRMATELLERRASFKRTREVDELCRKLEDDAE